MERKRGLFLQTYGCQMNVYESERLFRMLGDGYEKVDSPEAADLIFVNTCSVRDKPEQRVYAEVSKYKTLKVKNPELIVAVGGCVASQVKGELHKKLPHVDIVVNPDQIERVPALERQIREARAADAAAGAKRRPARGAGLVDTRFNKAFSYDDSAVPDDYTPGITAFLSIMKGCDKFCTFCIVPYTRGRQGSRPSAEITAEARALVAKGVREITLLGQNVNAYGNDLDTENTSLARLMYALAEIDGLHRIRYTTSHPLDFTVEQADAFRHPKVAKYLHLPLQAGDEGVLARMERGYTRAYYDDLMHDLRARIPGIHISGDFIVGFPGETEAEFDNTVAAALHHRYETFFGFMYSPRPFTKAAKLPDDVPDDVKLARLQRLLDVGRGLLAEALSGMIGRVEEILVEGPSERGEGLMCGRTTTNKLVRAALAPETVGTLQNVLITHAFTASLFGEAVPAGRA